MMTDNKPQTMKTVATASALLLTLALPPLEVQALSMDAVTAAWNKNFLATAGMGILAVAFIYLMKFFKKKRK